MLLLLPFAWPYLRRDMARLKEAWKPVLVLGTLGIGAFNTPLYTGLLTTTAVNGLLLQEEKTCWIIALIVGGIAGENGGAIFDHGSGGIVLLRAA